MGDAFIAKGDKSMPRRNKVRPGGGGESIYFSSGAAAAGRSPPVIAHRAKKENEEQTPYIVAHNHQHKILFCLHTFPVTLPQLRNTKDQD
jgi:hypothetical protein